MFVNPVNLQNLGTLGVEQFPNRTSNDFFQNRIYSSLTLLTAKCFPLKRVLKNVIISYLFCSKLKFIGGGGATHLKPTTLILGLGFVSLLHLKCGL